MVDKIMRKGKTEKDHKTGAWNNRFDNQAKRVSWQKGESKGGFPKETCNGKKNRLR